MILSKCGRPHAGAGVRLTELVFRMMIQTIADALAARGYETLTPVQEAVNAPELVNSDLLVSAQTGSGKTVGFGLAIAPTLLEGAETLGPAETPLALVIAPTRELALQVMRELNWLYAGTRARIASCVGGMDMRDEVRALSRGAHIVVGTPGRLTDHLRRGSLDLSGLKAVVLDEADEMLDLGFREDLEILLGAAPVERRTLLFSATVPPEIERLAREFQRDAVRLKLQAATRQHADISYQAVMVERDDAEKSIINLLLHHDSQNAIIFANTRMTVARLAARLQNRGLAVVALSGELSQNERSHALQAMRDGRARVCVATDVAARGIDLPNLDLVIHAELPTSPDVFLHRSGRTGRAGRKGIAAIIVSPRATRQLERLLKFAKVEAEWVAPPTAEEILRAEEERLLTNPLWTEEATEGETAFAQRLLEKYSPEVIAAGWLRAHRRANAAPEDLTPVRERSAVKSEGKGRADFGPSVWVTLSVGRNEQAEPRWLMPMILRCTGLDRGELGAIRVRDTETFVEIAATSIDKVKDALGSGGVIEKGIVVTVLDHVPDLGSSEGRPPRREGGFDSRGPRKPFHKGSRDDAPRGEWRGRDSDGEGHRPARFENRSRDEQGDRPWKSRGEDQGDRPWKARSGEQDGARSYKPREADGDRRPAAEGKPGWAKPAWAKPAGAGKDRPRGEWTSERPQGDAPRGKFGKFEKPAAPRARAGEGAPRSFAGKPGKPAGAEKPRKVGGFDTPRRRG